MGEIAALLAVAAARQPDRIAVKDADGKAISYRALRERSNRFASALLGRGLEAGDRLAIWCRDSIEYIEIYCAAAAGGFVVVPINERFKASEAGYQIDRTGAKALVFSSNVLAELDAVLAACDVPLLVGIDGAERQVRGALAFESLVESGRNAPLPPVDAMSPLSICFTSGTTGFPKGATLTHHSLKNVARTQAVSLRLSLGSINLQVASLSFPATFGSHICSHFYVGGTIVLTRRGAADAERLLALIARERVNHFYLPTPLLRDFATVCASDRASWASLSTVLHAGSRGDAERLGALAEIIGERYLEGWGMSEISGGLAAATSANDLRDSSSARNFFESVGQPVCDTMIRIVDEHRRPLPNDGDAVGELAVHSSSLMAGYWKDDAATAKAIEDGWYFTGDLGRIDPNGYVYIVDRRQDLIISGGMNIYPMELERVIEAMPGVAECAVVAGPHPRWGQTPVAVIAPLPGIKLEADTIIAKLSSTLADFKRPTRIIFVDKLPRHPTSNKILRNHIRIEVDSEFVFSGKK